MRAWLLLLALASAPALAHKPSDSYLTLEPGPGAVHGRWDIALRDLEFALGLDANGDGAITWGELRARQSDVAAYALARLALRADGRACPAELRELLVDEHSDGTYAVLRFDARCEGGAARGLEVEYRLFADLDPTHRGLLQLVQAGAAQSAVLGPDRPRIELALGEASRFRQFLSYAGEGVWHIWIGFDHILFLVSLLLPAVLVFRDGAWAPAARFRPVFWEVLSVVTAFTVAHSITLSLAALGVVSLPSRWVESLIALSVVLAALNNLWPVVLERRWMVAFGFGLVHGFGFASVLADLGLPRDALLVSLVGFNLGVEAGQLAVVCIFLPVAYLLRQGAGYRRLGFTGGSAAIVLVATVWMVERIFNLKLL
ncbi:MAG TPA: HupE/UreJ family protein [Burkholderiales bacterium]|nr:HupE/UreJ family protein [Burkholderiales bacterium]